MAILYCRHCSTGYGSIGEVPLKCPACDRVTTWTAYFPQPEPKVPYTLSINDHKFLRSLRIQSGWPIAGTVES